MSTSGTFYEHFEREFWALVNPNAKLDTVFAECRWAEGPVWFGDGGYLLWSDIPNDRIMRYIPGWGVSVYRSSAGYTNGHTRDRQGRLVSCSHGNRWVERTEIDGSISVLADSYQGRKLNSPNDVVVKSDGTIWFTDPAYGIESDYEGHKGEQEQGGCYVFRLDPMSGELAVVADDFVRPNGLAFSADESQLFVADSGYTHGDDNPRHIRVFDVGPDGRLSNSRVFIDVQPGVPDGFRLDTTGNLWVTAADGVHVYTGSGVLLGKIKTPKVAANLSFGGPKRNWLFICATDSLHVLYTAANGIQRP
jgi:gluconolactonase